MLKRPINLKKETFAESTLEKLKHSLLKLINAKFSGISHQLTFIFALFENCETVDPIFSIFY